MKDERLEKRWTWVRRVEMTFRRRVKYISCMRWDWLDDDLGIDDDFIMANLFEVIWLCHVMAVQVRRLVRG